MFESLSDKLHSVFAKLKGKGRLSEEDVNEALREVRLALLEADVNFKVVKEFVARVKERAVGEQTFESLNALQSVIKIVNEELIELLGGENARLNMAPRPPTIIMLCGLQGSGKTTHSGKLAGWFKKQGRNPLLVACDVYRPAAVKQLQVLGEQLKVPVYAAEPGVKPPKIAQDAVRHAAQAGCDIIILDTAGRLAIDDELMQELEQIKKGVQPTETLLVVDAMTGQDAVNFAQTFHERLAVDGFIMTKLDGDARGGAALSIKSVTGVPIKFIGVGEKLDALELFHPDRMASRILGMGDVLSLIERAQEVVSEKQAMEMEQKLRANTFDLNDFLDQLRQMRKMGPLDQILGMIPGMSKMKDVEVDENKLAQQEAIVLSMTKEERANPSLITGARRKRIAAGCGLTVADVNTFLTNFETMRTMVRQIMGAGGPPKMGGKFAGKLAQTAIKSKFKKKFKK